MRSFQIVLGAAHHMRKIDAEAGVASAGILSRFPGIENNDALIGPIPGKPTRCSKAGVSGTNHHPIRFLVAR